MLLFSGQQTAGMLSIKHIYEIAKVKAKDENLDGTPMETICNMIVGQCRSVGIKVVKHLDAEEYRCVYITVVLGSCSCLLSPLDR